MHERVQQEICTVREKFPELQHGEQWNWVLIPEYLLPEGRFNKETSKLLFLVPTAYPNAGPDNFFVDGNLRLAGGASPPAFNQGSNSSSGAAPVPGDWGWFSWHPQDWRPAAKVEDGDNLLTFLRGVNLCLRGEESA